MADFEIRSGTDWITTIEWGEAGERWRLDDYELFLQLKAVGSSSAALTLTLDNGGLVITDPIARRLEISASWEQLDELGLGVFEFDVLFVNRSTGLRDRSSVFTLSIIRGITSTET